MARFLSFGTRSTPFGRAHFLFLKARQHALHYCRRAVLVLIKSRVCVVAHDFRFPRVSRSNQLSVEEEERVSSSRLSAALPQTLF